MEVEVEFVVMGDCVGVGGGGWGFEERGGEVFGNIVFLGNSSFCCKFWFFVFDKFFDFELCGFSVGIFFM